MQSRIHQTIDKILMELGEYSPLELLLAEGRLLYADYEKWLRGEIDYLESCLFGDPHRVREMLLQAAEYAGKLGLQAQEMVFGDATGGKSGLKYSGNSEADQLFVTYYCKQEQVPQLDLFMDSGAVVLANDVQKALLEGDNIKSRLCLEMLYEQDPNYARLGEFDQLFEANEKLETEIADVLQHMEYLQKELLQMAQLVFGSAARQYLARHWRALGRQLVGQTYDAENPRLHLSYAAGQALDWSTVESSVCAESIWWHDATLLLRYAEACERQYKPEQAIWAWFLLCWQFPDKSDLIQGHAGEANRGMWLEFLDQDLDLEDKDFPSWVLLQKPGLSRTLPDLPDVYPQSFSLVVDLMAKNTDDVGVRANLRELNPVLFGCFLQIQSAVTVN